MSPLERRVRWLLRVYPAAYRAGRGDEITGTLLEATPAGRDWPPAREAASVVTAGLRARRAANSRQGLTASLRQAAVLAAVTYLVLAPGSALGAAIFNAREGYSPLAAGSSGCYYLLTGGLVVLMSTTVWSGRRSRVALAAVAAFIPGLVYLTIHPYRGLSLLVWLAEFAVPAVLVVIAPIRRTERLPKSLLWLPCLVFVLTVTTQGLLTPVHGLLLAPTVSRIALLFPYTSYLSLVTVVVAAGWLVTDARPLAALVFAFTLERIGFAVAYARNSSAPGPLAVALAVGASLTLAWAVVWLLHRRTRSLPPAAG